MSKVSPYILIFGLIALVYHLNPWRPGLSSGPGFDSPLDVTVGTWDREVVQERKPVLVVFHRSGATSNQLRIAVEDTQQALRGRLKVTHCDITDNASLAMRYRVSNTPTLLVFKDGLVADTLAPVDFSSFPALESKVLAYCEGDL